jgi:hypothetical protein
MTAIQDQASTARPVQALLGLINGFQVAQAIHVAAVLGIADFVRDRSCSVEDIAAAVGANEGALYRLLRALGAVGVVHEEDGRHFSLTDMGACLRSDAPESVAPWAVFIGQASYRAAWGALLHSVRTGENAFRHVYGEDVWSYRARNPDVSAAFDSAMTALSRSVTVAVLSAYDFSPFTTIVDVGGGRGALLAAILAQHPQARGVLFDQPHVVAGAAEVLDASGVAGRCDTVGGSFFDSVPGGADAYLLKYIIHDWEDEPASAILQTCRRAMRADSRLLVIERVIGPPNEGAPAKFSDLNMLVSPGGLERTGEEFASLLEAAGLRLTQVKPTIAGVSILEATPV